MKKNKLYILISLLTAVIIFNTAGLCNQCSITPSAAVTESIASSESITTETISETTALLEAPAITAAAETILVQEQQQGMYTNTQYGFSFSLPDSWEGYSIISSEWEGNPPGSETVLEKGPIISIRNPKWTQGNSYQDIPIMVFSLAQWDFLQQEKFHIGAAPIGPSELGRNTEYVFALPARYNFSYLTGWEEVEKILEGGPLKVF